MLPEIAPPNSNRIPDGTPRIGAKHTRKDGTRRWVSAFQKRVFPKCSISYSQASPSGHARPFGVTIPRSGSCSFNDERLSPANQGIQNGLAASKSAVQRDIPIYCRHLSSRLCSSVRERAQCHQSAISCLTSVQCKPLRG